MMRFTVEETNFMSFFDTASRKGLIEDMEGIPASYLDDETEELRSRIIKKLRKMTDGEFDALYIAPDSLLY